MSTTFHPDHDDVTSDDGNNNGGLMRPRGYSKSGMSMH